LYLYNIFYLTYFGIKKGELDLLSGGAPCQAFSYAGKRLGLEDARGTLFYHYATFLQKLQPKMFLFENVRGLLTHDKGRTYATITNIFEQAGYTIQKKVLNAWDFGVPQKRERLITVGIRNDYPPGGTNSNIFLLFSPYGTPGPSGQSNKISLKTGL